MNSSPEKPPAKVKTHKGFIVTSDYILKDSIPTIKLFGRLTNQKSFECHVQLKPYFFIKQSDEVKAKKILRIQTTPTTLHTMDEEEVVRVDVDNPKNISVLRKVFEDANIACFEADVPYTRRFLIDNNLFSFVSITGEEKPTKHTNILFENAQIKSYQPTKEELKKAQPTILSIDIETNEEASQVYSVSFFTSNYKHVFVVKHDNMKETYKHAELFDSEEKLLRAFIAKVNELDPDCITGWNVIDFDIHVLLTRMKKYGISPTFGRGEEIVRTRIESNFFRDSSAQCDGRLILDGIQILKSSFVKLDDYKLNTAAKHFLGEGKLIQENNRFSIIDEQYRKDTQNFIDYNLKDSELVFNILHESKLFELTLQRSLLTGLHMDEVKASIASFDSLYLRELRKAGYVAPSTRPSDTSIGIGGYVLDSKPGIYSQVIVLDFKSLYPSLMRTFSIDPLAYCGTREEATKKNKELSKKEDFVISPNEAVFETKKALLPDILEKFWNKRDEAKKAGNELARYAIKIHMNALYGVLASPNSRFHIRNLSNAITSFAQFCIKKTVSELEKKGYEVIYGDTDSVFVDIKSKDSKQAYLIGKQIEKDINKTFEEFITKEYAQNSVVELEFEKQFIKFFLPKNRGSQAGAKKRYAGLKISNLDDAKNISEEKIKTKMDFTGLEFVRRDWTALAKEFQLSLLELIFADKDPKKYIKTFVDDVYAGKHDDLLVYKKALRKKVEDYTKTTPPHVKAAKLLDKIEGSVISYVITKDGPQPIQKQTSSIDYDHYIEKQVKPIANSILEFFNTSFDDVIKGSEQKGLSGFF